jgi:hypothetical protein
VPSADSRAATAVPIQAIFVVILTAGVVVPLRTPPTFSEVSANAGAIESARTAIERPVTNDLFIEYTITIIIRFIKPL